MINKNIQSVNPNPASLSSVRLETTFDSKPIGVGTGFLWKVDDAVYLISAEHVFSGRHAESGKPLNKLAAIPNRVKLHVKEIINIPHYDSSKADLVRTRTLDVPLVLDHDVNIKQAWVTLEGSTGPMDVAALDVTAHLPETLATHFLNTRFNPEFKFELEVGYDVFIVGFPQNLAIEGFPIWKRGSIATEPQLDYMKHPMFLIDSATRPGLSGAPVFASSPELWFPEGETGSAKIRLGSQLQFVGIYSARTFAQNEFEAQLGYVWREDAFIKALGKISK